jgi:hypothetical protein
VSKEACEGREEDWTPFFAKHRFMRGSSLRSSSLEQSRKSQIKNGHGSIQFNETLKKAHGHRRGVESEKWVRVSCGILASDLSIWNW